MYTAWQDVEENYRKIYAGEEFIMKPRFYALTALDSSGNQEVPKLDGLACNFILGTPDKLRYPVLLDALIEILNITQITSGSISFLGLCCTQYCFTICWRYVIIIYLFILNIILICLYIRLLQLLPPSTTYMEKLASSDDNLSIGTILLHSLIWGPRVMHKNYNRWLKDCLVKQGFFTQHTDKLLKTVSDNVNNLKFDINNAKNCIMALTPDVMKGNYFVLKYTHRL